MSAEIPRRVEFDDLLCAEYLRQIPAAVRFLSVEPLIEPVGDIDLTGIDWVIVGGECGPGTRPMAADWAREVRDQCLDAGVAFFIQAVGQCEQKGDRAKARWTILGHVSAANGVLAPCRNEFSACR